MPDDRAYRRKRLLVADMESTIIEQECLDELADFVGLRPRIAAITERAMRGELEFEAAIKERVGLLKDLHAGVLDDLYSMRVTLMPGALTLSRPCGPTAPHCALVSAASTFSPSGSRPASASTPAGQPPRDRRDGRIAGTVAQPILGREAKLAALERLTTSATSSWPTRWRWATAPTISP